MKEVNIISRGNLQNVTVPGTDEIAQHSGLETYETNISEKEQIEYDLKELHRRSWC